MTDSFIEGSYFSRTWGFVVLTVSALYFLAGMGGFNKGTLGIVGGALAISWRPASPDS